MKRKEQPNRLAGLLRAAALAAFAMTCLLATAATASAQNAHVIIEGSGSGTVVGVPPLGGEPEINCEYASPGPATGICDTDASVGSGGLEFLRVEHQADPGSVFAGWTVIDGATECEELDEKCNVLLVGSEIKIKAVFKKLNAHIAIDGSGAGKVVGVSPAPGEPTPIECTYASPGPEADTCDVVAQPAGPFTVISVEAEPDPGSAWGGWTIEEGVAVGGCAGGTFCSIRLGAGGEIHLKGTFEEIPFYELNLTTSGSGSGSFQCDTGSGPEGCEAEYEGGTQVTVIANEDAGSEFVAFSGDCDSVAGNECEVEMDGDKNIDAEFNLETRTLTVEVEGEGEITGSGVNCDEEAKNGGPECEAEFPYGTSVTLAVAAQGENVIGELTGSNSAAGECEFETATGSCEFTITEDSEVSAVFVAGNTIDTQEENVHGEVPQTTELASSCDIDDNGEGEVDFGEFIPGEAETYLEMCALTVTATGEENKLTAADESLIDTGHLTQKPGHPYSLPRPLETKANGLPGLEFPGVPGSTAFTSLASPVALLTYGGPVGADAVTLSFRQIIGLHDALHTGEYKKTILLTLKQTAL